MQNYRLGNALDLDGLIGAVGADLDAVLADRIAAQAALFLEIGLAVGSQDAALVADFLNGD